MLRIFGPMTHVPSSHRSFPLAFALPERSEQLVFVGCDGPTLAQCPLHGAQRKVTYSRLLSSLNISCCVSIVEGGG
ncbi:MAG: DUF723 domain-containing protein [Ktedonobacterales bacterium]|nr:DUF723 domain-containing protein [Ktedonobacterales bacterium]